MRHAGSVWLCALAVLSACGGESASHSSGSGAGATGGSALGGTSSSAAGGVTSGSGGDLTAGKPSGTGATGAASGPGGTVSVAGQAGGAGMIALSDLPPCLQPVDSGTCRGAFAVYAFDPESIACKAFTYGGCDGNENRFDTLEACEAACVSPLLAYCDESPRPTGCPCTAHSGCTGVCAIPDIRGDRCAPSSAGYCEGISERCSCSISGIMVCGV